MNAKRIFQVLALIAATLLFIACSKDDDGGSAGGSAPASYTVGGTVSGLIGTVVLQNNGGDDLALSTNEPFTFPTALADGAAYNVSVKTQPAHQTCTASANSGQISGANVTTVSVVCSTDTYTVGGNISGLNGTVVLTNNNGDDLTVSSNGPFTFNMPVADGAGYGVAVKTQPTGQLCTASNNSGTISGADVANVSIVCSVNTYTVGGNISGLSGTVILTNNNGDDLSVSSNGSFSFTTSVAHGAGYSVTVKTHPAGQQCFVNAGSGAATGNVTDVAVQCLAKAVLNATALPRTVNLTWNDVGATSYDLYYSTDSNCDIASIYSCANGAVINAATSPYAVKNLTNGQHYTFWLKANNAWTIAQSGARPDKAAVDGVVNAIVKASDGRVYLGGSFTQIGARSGGGVLLYRDAVGTRPFPVVEGGVVAVVPDGAGGWYIGGFFTHVGGVARNNIAHILAGGSVSDWNPNANEAVSTLALSSDGATLYAGGWFTTIGGQPRNYIAALNTAVNTNNATAWNADASNGLNTLALSSDGATLYAGGEFTTIGGQPRNRIAALDANTNTNNATAWNPDANGNVNTLAVNGATVYAGGSFTTIGGQTRNRIAALDTTTGNATAWDPNANGPVVTIAVNGTTVYAGGSFGTIGGQPRNGIAALNTAVNTNNATGWYPDASSRVTTLALSSDGATLYAGGWFDNIGGQPRSRIAALHTAINTNNATNWNPGAGGNVHALAVSGDTVYAGGGFSTIGGETRNNIAELDANGELTDWNPNASGTVSTLALSSDGATLYAGGSFTTIGGQTRNRIAAINTAVNTNNATDWNPNANEAVLTLALSSDGATLYVGGYFFSIGGQPRNNIAAISTAVNTNNATDWNPGASSTVATLALSSDGGTLYAGGWFTTIGGQPRNYIAALSTAVNTNNATGWNPGANSGVNTLALSSDGTTVYAGGYFTTIGGQVRNHIAALDAAVNTNNATAWNPNANSIVNTLAVSGSTVYAGGRFRTIGGQVRNYITALDTATGSATAWNPGANSYVNTLALSSDGATLYAGGQFTTIGGEPAGGFAALQVP